MPRVIHCVSRQRPDVTAASTHAKDPFGVPLCVDQGQRHTPRASDHDLLVDTEVQSQPLHVSDQMISRIRGEVSVHVADRGPAAATASLIENDRPVASWIEVRPSAGTGRRTRAAVDTARPPEGPQPSR